MVWGMNDCRQIPGSLHSSCKRGQYPKNIFRANQQVWGLMATPAYAKAFDLLNIPCRCLQASIWTVRLSAPAFKCFGIFFRFFNHQVNITVFCGWFPEELYTTIGPKLILGTNLPSITSRWNQSASLLFSISQSLCRLRKSADKKWWSDDGHGWIVECWMLNVECWMLNVECWMLNVECWMLNERYPVGKGENILLKVNSKSPLNT